MGQVTFTGAGALRDFAEWVTSNSFSRVEILVDQHTSEFCLPRLRKVIDWAGDPIVLPVGEESKSIDGLHHVWMNLLERKIDRHGVLINLGGGVITDLGGFAASTFKRGIPFVHIPTSLLAQVDAAIGHKTGIDVGGVKNSVGTFAEPDALVVDPVFLETLPDDEYRSGMAEVFKHSLIADRNLWDQLDGYRAGRSCPPGWIQQAAEIKLHIVSQDPREQNRRKLLNFGHSLGHAVESVALTKGILVRHGEAVAAGMLMEAYLSHQLGNLAQSEWDAIRERLTRVYEPLSTKLLDPDPCIAYLRNDKKNRNGSILMVLLDQIGKGVIDRNVTEEQCRAAMHAYPGFYSGE